MTNLIHLESRTLGAAVSCHGASLTQLISKKRHVELLLDSSLLAAALIDEFCIGGTAGPYAGRLRQAKSSAGESTVLLHGGESALHRLDWRLEHTDHATTVRYVTSLSHGEGGLPGARNFGVSYTLVDDCLIIELAASTSHDTPVSLTNHAYFTLGARSVSELMLQINAKSVLGTDDRQCATGESLAVAGTQLDFTQARSLSSAHGHGCRDLDHSYVLEPSLSGRLATESVAVLSNPGNGISLHVATSQPCLQVYTASQLRAPLNPYSAICLEAQGFPNGPHHALGRTESILSAGHTVTQRIVYQITDS